MGALPTAATSTLTPSTWWCASDRASTRGLGGETVFLTNAAVDQPLRPFDNDDARSLIEKCGIKESKPQWSLKRPPQKTARAVRVHVLLTLLMFALATASRRPCEQEKSGGESVGWQCRRRQLQEQTREQVIVFAQGYDGIFPLAEYSLLVGVKLTDVLPDIGTRQDVLAQFGLIKCGQPVCWHLRRSLLSAVHPRKVCAGGSCCAWIVGLGKGCDVGGSDAARTRSTVRGGIRRQRLRHALSYPQLGRGAGC
jgi:hypothetical protein